MRTQLRLVTNNPDPLPCQHMSGPALHRLADHLTEQVRAGNTDLARRAVSDVCLNPLGVAAVATWMYRAGLSEDQIIEVVA